MTLSTCSCFKFSSFGLFARKKDKSKNKQQVKSSQGYELGHDQFLESPKETYLQM